MPEFRDFDPVLAALWISLNGLKQAQACAEDAGLMPENIHEIEQACAIVDKTLTQIYREQYQTPVPISRVQPLRFKKASTQE